MRILKFSVHYSKYSEGKIHDGAAIIIKSIIKHNELTKYSKKHFQVTSMVVGEAP